MTDEDPSLDGASSADWGARPTATDLDNALLRRDVHARLFGTPWPVTIGRYVVARRLGAGGMGIVYAAHDPELDREVALKLVLPGHAAGQQRIVREARALAKLSHPNVVTIHEVGIHGDDVFVAMELISGTTLREWLATPRSLAAIAGVFRQAALGLDAAHQQGLVHRDFKPDNVLIDASSSRPAHEAVTTIGRVRVIDFGLALAETETTVPGREATPASVASRLSITGELLGTPGYMAREQLFGGTVDLRTDVFAFAATLYEALHERLPFEAHAIAPLLDAVARGPGDLPFRRDLPRALVTLLRSALDPDPQRRPPDLHPFIAALARIESPPRHRPLLLGLAGAFVLGGGAAAIGVLAASDDREERAAAEVVTPEPPPPAGPLVCEPGPVDEDVDCTALLDRLVQPGAVDDEAARCSFRRACSTPNPTCSDSTAWDGTLGCAADRCAAVGLEEQTSACVAGSTACCVAAANEHIVSERPADPGERRQLIADRFRRACAEGDAPACGELELIALRDGDRESAFSARVTACGLGNVQACRRIAMLAEEREGVDEKCVERPMPACFQRPLSTPQKLRMAECRSVVLERPWATFEGSMETLAAEFEAAKIALAPGEPEAIDRAGEAFRIAARDRIRTLLAAAGESVAPEESLAQLSERLMDVAAGHGGLSRALQKLADARADLEPARPETSRRLADDAMRAYAELPDALGRALVAELGAARVAELRERRPLWPGSHVSTFLGACPHPS